MRQAPLVVVLLVACGEPLPEDGGELAEQFGEAFCLTLADCEGLDATEERQCIDLFISGFCSEISCTTPLEDAPFTRREWNDCLDAVESMPCSELQEDPWSPPRECLVLQ